MVKFSVFAAALAIVLATATPGRAQIGPLPQGLAQGGPQSSRACAVIDVSVFTDRVHVRCGLLGTEFLGPAGFSQTVTPENYYAVATDSNFAPIFATVATAAQQARKVLTIIFLTDTAQNPPGCQPSDCRAVVGARFIP